MEDYGIDGIEFCNFDEINKPTYFNYDLQFDAAIGVCLDSFKNDSFHSVLCFGRPGTGKSIFAKKLCILLEKYDVKPNLLVLTCNSILASSSTNQEILDALSTVLKTVENKRPMVVVLDEIDALTQERLLGYRRLAPYELTQWFMNIFDKKFSSKIKEEGQITVFGFTNDLEHIDEAILKRFDHHFYFDLPDDEVYYTMLRYFKIKNEKEIFQKFKEITLGCRVSGSNFMKACANLAKEINQKQLTVDDCANALVAWCGPNLISEEDQKSYKIKFAPFIKTANVTMQYWQRKKDAYQSVIH